MNKPLKILHLEDLPHDAEFVARELTKSGIPYESVLVENKTDFINALKEFSPDIILSDHSLPGFDSHQALKIVKDMGMVAPFILVTATVSEEYAVSTIKDGASDYILKDRLQRLPNAILGALDKSDMEAARRQADEALRASERKYKLLFEGNPLPMWMLSISTQQILAVNEAACNHYGYSMDEFLKLNAKELRPAEDVEKYLAYIRSGIPATNEKGIWRHKKKDGSVIMVDILAHDVMYENMPARLVLANDVTEKINVETELARQRLIQQKLITETGIQVQEREREEIGKELHDNISQILVTAKLYLDQAIKKEQLSSPFLQNSLDNIHLAIQETRKLSHTLVAPSLGNITLIQAIEGLLRELRLVADIQGQLITTNYNEDVLNKNIKLVFYRIVQEQINNILKHSGAKSITIQLSTLPAFIHLTITDDGRGFDTGKKNEGIGLRNIRNRAEFYDGSMRIITAPGQGCTLEVSIPA